MTVAIVNDEDSRVSDFLMSRDAETFLLNASSGTPTDFRIARLNAQDQVTALISVTGSLMKIQMPAGYDQMLLFAAIEAAKKRNPPILHAICADDDTQQIARDLSGIGLQADIADAATFFQRELHDLSPREADDSVAIRPLRHEDSTFLSAWLRASLPPSDENDDYARQLSAQRCSGEQEFWVLEKDGKPVSIGGITERNGNMLKIAGVLTKEDCRGKGHAPLLIASFLGAAYHSAETGRAVLLARTDTARRCYDAMGFERIGNFTTLDLSPL